MCRDQASSAGEPQGFHPRFLAHHLRAGMGNPPGTDTSGQNPRAESRNCPSHCVPSGKGPSQSLGFPPARRARLLSARTPSSQLPCVSAERTVRTERTADLRAQRAQPPRQEARAPCGAGSARNEGDPAGRKRPLRRVSARPRHRSPGLLCRHA